MKITEAKMGKAAFDQAFTDKVDPTVLTQLNGYSSNVPVAWPSPRYSGAALPEKNPAIPLPGISREAPAKVPQVHGGGGSTVKDTVSSSLTPHEAISGQTRIVSKPDALQDTRLANLTTKSTLNSQGELPVRGIRHASPERDTQVRALDALIPVVIGRDSRAFVARGWFHQENRGLWRIAMD